MSCIAQQTSSHRCSHGWGLIFSCAPIHPLGGQNNIFGMEKSWGSFFFLPYSVRWRPERRNLWIMFKMLIEVKAFNKFHFVVINIIYYIWLMIWLMFVSSNSINQSKLALPNLFPPRTCVNISGYAIASSTVSVYPISNSNEATFRLLVELH